jgi:hypothetical protein
MLYFLIWACREYRDKEDFQVMDFGGVDELRNCLSLLTRIEGYDQVETLVIGRDAETDVASAIVSVRDSMRLAKMPVPDKPFEYVSQDGLRTAFVIFPGPQCKRGTLEDLCLLTVTDDPIMPCVDDFLVCVGGTGETLPRPHKSKLHCFLAGKDTYVGSTIGQASYKGAWNAHHNALQPFKSIIQKM